MKRSRFFSLKNHCIHGIFRLNDVHEMFKNVLIGRKKDALSFGIR